VVAGGEKCGGCEHGGDDDGTHGVSLVEGSGGQYPQSAGAISTGADPHTICESFMGTGPETTETNDVAPGLAFRPGSEGVGAMATKEGHRSRHDPSKTQELLHASAWRDAALDPIKCLSGPRVVREMTRNGAQRHETMLSRNRSRV
jgi:hypothetical protein